MLRIDVHRLIKVTSICNAHWLAASLRVGIVSGATQVDEVRASDTML